MITREQKGISDSSSHPADSAGTQTCILLVEDDPSLRRYLQIVLERSGHEVKTAADGLEATTMLMSLQVDAVVTDAMMPNLNGYELCRFIRRNANLSHLPIVLLSALDPCDEVSDPQQADVFLSKLVSPVDLVNCVRELVSQRQK